MAVFRVEKNHNYTVMSNYHLRDTRLTLKSIGLLSKMLSLTDEWDHTTRGNRRIRLRRIRLHQIRKTRIWIPRIRTSHIRKSPRN